MKKLLMTLLTSVLVACLFPTAISAKIDTQEPENKPEYLDYIVMEDGTIAEKITTEELIIGLSKVDNLSPSAVMNKYGINPLLRDSSKYENYVLSKSYTFNITGFWGGTCNHQAFVQLTRSNDYTDYYVNQITNVYSSGLTLNSSDFWLEETTNYVNSWNTSRVAIYWYGNICYKSPLSVSVGSEVSVSGSNPYIYRLHKGFDSTLSCPQW
ncbi:hypothetical protein [Holdemania filiformis]|uniref:hypothetical protein n=1 Tax=Holdemania filiformis TaxID=61171 RepID=UPI00242DF3B1|nr:hypothetical protein [Holdemania filiformis]